jgi:hypothetical protein
MCAAWLIVIGGALQIAGVALVFQQIRRVRRDVNLYLARPRNATAHAVPAHAKAMVPKPNVGTPNLQQRVEALEVELAATNERLAKEVKALGDELRSDMVVRDQTVAREAGEETAHLAELVLRLQITNWWKGSVGLGAVLIAAGVAASAIGSLLAL